MTKLSLRTIYTLLLFHLLWGVVLFGSVSKYGLGVSSDSIEYLFAGLNLTRGLGLVNYELSPVLLWPPLYPALLALVHWATGLGMLASALAIQIFSFILLGWMAAWLFLRIFPDEFRLAGLALLMLDSAPVTLLSAQMVGTDYLFLALVTTFAVFSSLYIDQPSPRRLLPMAVLGILAPLLRLVGFFTVVAGILIVWTSSKDNIRQRLGQSAWLGITALPAVLWVLLTWNAANPDSARAPLTFVEDFKHFSHGIVNWFISPEMIEMRPMWYALLPWLILTGLILFLFVAGRRWHVFNRYTSPVMGLGAAYLVFLFASARLKYINRLVGRFTLPILIPLILLVLLTIYVVVRNARQRSNKGMYFLCTLISLGILILSYTPLLLQTKTILLESYAHGVSGPDNIFNSETANQNPIIQFWKANPPMEDYILFANSHEYLAFQTWEIVRASPRKYSGPYDQKFRPLESYYSVMFQPGKVTYLIWFGAYNQDYVYTPGELGQAFHLETIVQSQDGGIFIITPGK